MYPDNGRITVPAPHTEDDQGRTAFLSIRRGVGEEAAVYIDQQHVTLIDEVTKTRIIFDGSKITILRGDEEYFDLPLPGEDITIMRGKGPDQEVIKIGASGEDITLIRGAAPDSKLFHMLDIADEG